MIRRYYTPLISLLLILTLFIASVPALAQSRSVYWLNWNIDIDAIDMVANRFHVVETHDVQFTGGFTFGTRVLEKNNLDSIENIRVYEDGEALTRNCSGSAGTYCVNTTSNEWQITYYFKQQIISDRQVFRIEYDVVGALRSYEGGDQLWWMAIPYEHYGYAIASSVITVDLPKGYAPRDGIDQYATYGADGEATLDGNRVTARTIYGVGPKENFEIRVQFPHHPDGVAPAWQSNFDMQRNIQETVMPFVNIGFLGLGGLLSLAGPLGVLTIWRRKGRDPEIGPVPEYLSEPPSDLHPSVVGTLIDEKAEIHDIIAILVGLAHKGYIVMEETRSEGLFGIGGSRKYTFKRTDKKSDRKSLTPFESRFMREMFSGGRMERTLDSMKDKFYKVIPKLQSDLYEQLVQEGFMNRSPEFVRNAWAFGGVALMGIGGVIFVFAMGMMDDSPYFSPAFLCVPIGLAIFGAVTVFVGRHMPAKTQRGAEETAKWNAFKTYLANLDKYSSVEAAADRFDEYLPYAVAFGLERSWVNRFSKIEHMPIPTWYYPTYLDGPYRGGYRAGTPLSTGSIGGDVTGGLAQASGGGFSLDSASGNLAGGLQSMSDGLTNMLSSASSVMTSQPSSSGSGGWSGGGFSGGGSSGGGSAGFG